MQSSSFTFLRELQANNNREWFADHKAEYVEGQKQIKALGEAVQERMNEIDVIASLKIYRIYRDVRFSKDKTPYKNSLSGSMVRATKWRRGGYYFHVEPNGSFLAAGFWNPNAADLSRIRQEIAANPAELREIITAEKFVKYFGQLEGEQLKTAPRGYAKDHPAVDLLRYKQLLVTRYFTDEEVLQPSFVDEIVETFKAIRPFLDYMSEVLTTDANGTPIE